MKRTKLLSAAVALMLSIGLLVSCENNPVAPVENTATQPALQLSNDVQAQPLTAEALGLAKSVGLHSYYGKISKRRGGWLSAPGVLLHMPPDNNWNDREHYYFEITLADNAAELLSESADNHPRRGHQGNFGQIKKDIQFGFNITLYDHRGNPVHINLDYSAWPDPNDLNPIYQEDKRDDKDGTATIYIHKSWLKYLDVDEQGLFNTDCTMVHYDPDGNSPDGNVVSESQDYHMWLSYDLPGFSKWAWTW